MTSLWQEAFATHAGISPLVTLLAGGNDRAQQHAMHALASLGLENTDNQSQITMLLVGLLGNGSTDAKSRAAALLW